MTSNLLKSLLSLGMLGLALLSGCASVKPAGPGQEDAAKRFEVPATQSRIYVYRNEFMGTLVGLDLLLDGRPAGTTKGKTFVVADVEAGEHQLVSKGENTHSLTLTTRAGESSFVWQEVKMGLLSAGSRLHSVDAAAGRAGVLETRLVDSPLMKTADATKAAVAAKPAVAAAAPAAPPLAAAPSMPPSVPASASRLHPSRFEYEAERAAKEAGCIGPNGVRPTARLDSREGVIEIFTVQCAASSLRVRCDMGMCRAQP